MKKLSYSFIIPCFNEEKDIGNTIDACLKQAFDGEYQIILVDDASIDSTSVILNEYLSRSSRILYMQNERNMGVSYSRNRGIQSASGEILIFLNADELPDENYLININRLFERGADYVFPQTIVNNDATLYGIYRQAYRQSTYTRENMIMWSQGFACKKTIVMEVGMFDSTYPGCGGEDWDLVSKIDKLSYCRVTDFSIIVKHNVPEKAKEIIWHMYNRGRGTANYHLIYCHVSSVKILLKFLIRLFCFLAVFLTSRLSFLIFLSPIILSFVLKSYEMAKSINQEKSFFRILFMNVCNVFFRSIGYYYTIWKGKN